MRISIGQIIVVIIILFLLFGDLQSAKKGLLNVTKQINKIFQEKNRKKGT
uniref:Sec-independent protein translocase component tatA n=3 Tax=Nitzschia TaxID=2857 RepID=A0A2Z5ZBF9_9STRA|nr:tatAE [Nitzschia sp. (in: diatoms)]AWQ64294.1 tatAE [Nitzschia sp. (in: diatoms)]BBC77758.1 Sec-independent protein translocase component tatA [Nitzschia sp. NIES-3581]BCQ06497.1 Sec-independent protein translocase component tatA [Nitzschia putrida]